MLARLFHFLISLLLLPLACLILWLLQVWPRLVQSLSADAEPEDEDDEEIYLPIVKLRLRPTCTKFCREHCPSVTIRALVDTGSGVSYVSGRVVEKLQLKASPVRLNNRYYWRQCRFEDSSTEGLALTSAVRVVLEALEDEEPSTEVVTVYVFPGERIPINQKPPSARICHQLLEKKTIQLIDDPELDLVESFPEDAEAIDLVIGQDLYCRKVLEERQAAVPLSFNQVVLRTQFGHVLQGGGRVVQTHLQELSDVSLLQILLLPPARYIIRGIFQARTYFWCEVRQLRSLICGFIWQRRFAAIPETPQAVGHTPQLDQHLIPPIKTINLPTLVLTVGNAQHRNSFSKCIRVLLDSGAKYSTISPKTVRSLELPLELVMPPKVLYDFTGTPYHLYTSVVLCLVSPLDSEDGQLVRLYVDPIEDRVPADGPRSLLLDEAIFRHIELTDGTPEEGDIIEAIIGQDLLTSTFLMEPEQVAILSAAEETAPAPTCWAFIPTMYGNVAVGVGYETGTSAIIGNEGQSRR